MMVEDVLAALEKVAPVGLSDEFCNKYKMYDNSGIIINCGGEVTGVLFALDLSEKAVKEAKRQGFNLIATHHPAIYGGISRLDLGSNAQARALAGCLKSGISVISMHLNFDAAKEGIDFHLAKGLGALDISKAKIAAPVSSGGYGRVYEIEPCTLGKFTERTGKEFSSLRVIFYGDKDRKVKRVASFCGAGCDDNNMSFALENGADVFVSSDMKHHEILALTGAGLGVVVLTHYAAENYGFGKIYLKIKEGLKVKSAYFTDAELL